MANETITTIIGNLTADPEVHHTQNGVAVANFTIASTPRTFNKNTNQWEDGEALFMRCAAWRELGEHAGQSLHKGDRVIVQGRLVQRTYETKEGEKRSTIQLEVDEIGPSLKFVTAQLTKEQKQQGQAKQGGWGSFDSEVPF